MIRHRRTLYIVHPATTFLNRVFTKENTISSLRQSSSPFFLQEFRPLILLKTKDRFTSLTVIRVTKIMCNIFLSIHNLLIIIPIALHFSMQTSHSYRILPASSSIRIGLNISIDDMHTSKFLLMTVGPLGIFHYCGSHIGTKLIF
jgi:uncharacterized membrane protein